MNYERFWSNEARRFRPATLAGLQHRFAGVPDVISLAAGLPPSASFPLTALSANTRDGKEIHLVGSGPEEQVFAAQQYSFHPQGLPPLVEWLRNLTRTLHRVPVTGVTPPPTTSVQLQPQQPQSQPPQQQLNGVCGPTSGEDLKTPAQVACGNRPPGGVDNAPAGATDTNDDVTTAATGITAEFPAEIITEFNTEFRTPPITPPLPNSCPPAPFNGPAADSTAVLVTTTPAPTTAAPASPATAAAAVNVTVGVNDDVESVSVVQQQEGKKQSLAMAQAAAVAGCRTSFDVVLTNGATQAICAVIACLTDPGDTLIVDEYTFTHAVECIFLPRQLRLLPVRCDSQGMDPEALDERLRKVDEQEGGWDERDGTSDVVTAAAATTTTVAAAEGVVGEARSGAMGLPGIETGTGTGTGAGIANGGAKSRRRWQGWRRPRLLYTIPTGHNPTGAIMGTERRRRLLEVCAAHDLLILEDDAYCWLSYPDGPAPPEHQPGLGGLSPSLLSLDTTPGRVVRVDTFSKLLGPGYRLGWITGPASLVSKLAMWVMGTTVGPCSVAQVLVLRLLQTWGMEGFASQLRTLQALYANRAQAAEAAAKQHLSGLAEWQPVRAGMFMWIKLLGLDDAGALLDDLVAARVVVVPGNMFAVRNPQDGGDSSHDTHHNTITNSNISNGFKNITTSRNVNAPALSHQIGDQMCPQGAISATGLPTSPYLRLSFASCAPEVLGEGMRRLAEVVRTARARTALHEAKYGSG